MGFCSACHIVLKEGTERCPLCGGPASEGREPEAAVPGGASYPDSRVPSRAIPNDLTEGERRRVVVELLSVAAGIALVVTVLTDLFVGGGFSWSLYSSVGIAALWLFSAMPLILRRRLWILFAVLAPSTVLLVFLLDVFDGKIQWFLGYGLPIVLALAGCAAAAGAVIAAFKRHGLNTVAVILSAVALFCCALELIIDLNLTGSLRFDWSVVSALALIPTAALLFYLHYRIVHQASLRKLFRL